MLRSYADNSRMDASAMFGNKTHHNDTAKSALRRLIDTGVTPFLEKLDEIFSPASNTMQVL